MVKTFSHLMSYASLILFVLLTTAALPAVVGQALAAPAEQPRTGQTTVYSTGDDGALQTGVAWPSPRFTNADGTTPVSGDVVVDQLTGLIWTKDSNAPGPATCGPATAKSWQGALDYVACLNTNSYLGYNDWRLPNVNELESLVHGGQTNTATWLNTQGFTNAQADPYWSSTTYASLIDNAWVVNMYYGLVYNRYKLDNYYVWPVRSGQSGSFAYLTISKSGTGSGTVSVDKGAIIWFGSTGTASYGSAMTVNLSAVADSGTTFAGWFGACTGTGACTVTMDSDKSVTAAFTAAADATAPTTTASPAGGSYSSAQSVTLTCSDGAGSGCDKIYYTTDGSTPTTLSTVYTTPITISSTITLKFFAKDLAGNSEAVKTEVYTINTGVTPNKIAAGGGHTVTIKSDGTLWAWGSNGSGQLGDGNFSTGQYSPVQIGSDTTWSQIAAGSFHTVAIKSDGTLWAWGGNYSGQLGLPGEPPYPAPTKMMSPVQTGAGTTWSQIATGGDRTTAIKSDGTLWYCGAFDIGLSNDTLQQIGTDSNWSQVDARYNPYQPSYYTVAIKSDGTLWEVNGYDLVQKGTDTNWSQVAAGMALKSDGTLWEVSYGYDPVQIGTDTNWSKVAAGYGHRVAIKSNGTLWAWGSNMYGQLGDGTAWKETPQYIMNVSAADTTPPTGSISINSGAAYTNSTSATLTLSCTDTSGCSQMQFSNDNTNWSTIETYGTSKTWALSSGNGTKTVYVKFKDGAGNWSTATISDTIVLDTTAPTTTASPAGGTYTLAQSVTLTCSNNDSNYIFNRVVDVNNPIVGSWGAGVNGSNILSLTFYPNGTYIHWENCNDDYCTPGVEYGTYSYDAVNHILTATPTIDNNGQAGLSHPDGDLPGGAGITVSLPLTVTGDIIYFQATDAGCYKIYYTIDGSTPTTSSSQYSAPISISATTTLKFFAKDLAGNSEVVKTETYIINIDTAPPTGTISINSGAASTNSTTATLTLSCTDTSGCSEMQFSNDNTTWTTAEAYSSSKVWSLTTGDGTKTVYVKFKDTAGNWSSAFNDTITLDTPPSKPANIDVAQNGVRGELVISWSNPSDADFNHIHIYRSTASGTLGTLIADNVTGIKYTDTGLASLTTYYYTIRAVDNAGNESTNTNATANEYGYYPKAKTLDATPPAVPANVTAVDATTGGKINLSWTNPTDSDFSMIKIYRSTESGTLGSAVFIGVATSYSNTGLTNGVAYYYTVRAIDTSSNETTNTAQVSATPTAPDATPPSVPTTGGTPVVNTQAGGTLTISWTNPADSDFAFVRIYRSTTSGVLGNLVYDNVTGTSVTDTGLTNNATYYYTIRSVDTAGNESTNTNQVSGMPTDIQVPMKVTGLTTTLLSDGKIRLEWTRSSSTDVNAYNIYYDNGTGTINYNYADKIGTVQHPTTTWTSGNLAVGPAYKLAVRAEDAAQNEETGTTTVVSAVPVTDPNAGDVKGYIKVPQIGQKISGNRVTVVTDLLTGASIDVKDMRLQYKPASSGSWTDITPADSGFPNPDTTYPWFTHWDVTPLATGDYLIRAIATNINLSIDATPAYITVTVDNSAPEASEGTNAQNEPEKRQDVSANAANKTAIATESGVTELAIPEGALSTDTKVTVTVEAPATKDSLVPSGYGKANEFRDITLDSGQTSLSNNKEAEIVIPYKDDNNDNIIDGTTTKVYDTKVMRYNETTLKWEKLDSIVDTTNKVVKGKTNHFTLFGLLAPPNPTTPGWNLVSVPLNPSPNSASSVFGQTPYVYNPTTNSYTRPSTITPGIGYWINGGANLTATGTETPTTGNFSITLKKGWNMIGNPFRFKVKVSDMKVNYNSTEYTMTQAETNGIVVGTLYPYVNGVYQFVNASDGGAVEPWVGYWILSDKDCTLLVPPIPAQ